MNRTLQRRSNNQLGQAMVEFVIFLIVVMTLCSGMLYANRLLLFDFWAQQESRILAFEQTWVPHSATLDPYNAPINFVETANLGKFDIIGELDKEREILDDGGISDLLPLFSLRLFGGGEDTKEKIKAREESPVMLARSDTPFWRNFSPLREAVATENTRGVSLPRPIRKEQPSHIIPTTKTAWEVADAAEKLLEMGGFGDQFCAAMRSRLKLRYQMRSAMFDNPGCAEYFSRGFAKHIGERLNPVLLAREIGDRIDSGFAVEDALDSTLRAEVAEQFYSFFDTSVAVAFQTAPAITTAALFELQSLASDSQLQDMITDLRYIGSSVAILALIEKLGEILTLSPANRDYEMEKELEESVSDLLHIDGEELLGISLIDNGFYLNPTYLPVPPIFGPIAGGLQSGMMRNFLAEETSLFGPLIDQSNKSIEVTYHSGEGIFPAASRRFSNTDKALTARFYLVTQPWHITRRQNATGNFREKGTQFDSKSEETEEAVLRRRVLGLWMFPSRPSALLEPLTSIPELSFLQPVATILSTFDGFISTIKGFITDNPLLDIVDALASIPGFGNFIPTLPKWPTVRPDAYPGSTEMAGDRMAGEERNYSDYIDEQEEFNPPPDPEFN